MIRYWKIHSFPPGAYMILTPWVTLQWAVVDNFGNIVPIEDMLLFQYYREDEAIYVSE
jgi:hypothetical protein